MARQSFRIRKNDVVPAVVEEGNSGDNVVTVEPSEQHVEDVVTEVSEDNADTPVEKEEQDVSTAVVEDPYEEITVIPVSRPGREKKVNPHENGVKRAVELKGTGRGLATKALANDDVKKNVTWLRKAGAEKNVTINVKIVKVDENTSKIEFWATDKVNRPRKNKTAESASPTGTESPNAAVVDRSADSAESSEMQ